MDRMRLATREQAHRTLESVLDLTGVGLWEWDLVDGWIGGDARLEAILALPGAEWRRLSIERWAGRVHGEDRPRFDAEAAGAEQGAGFDAIYRLRRGDGHWIWVHDRSGVLYHDAEGRPVRLVGVLEDVTQRQEERRRWVRLARSIPGVIYTFVLDAEGRPSFPYTSDRVKDFYGVTPEQVQRDPSLVFDAIHPEDLSRVMESIELSARTLEDWQCEYRARAGDGWHWVEGRSSPERQPDGSTIWHGLIFLIDQRKELEARLRHLSLTDALTGLYNRRHLLACMEEEMSRFRRYGTPFSVVMFDLDNFKRINDRHGHAAGDAVLKRLAAILEERLREIDIAGRTGGEEFLLLLPGTDASGGARIAEDLCAVMVDEAFRSEEKGPFRVTLSAGVTEAIETDERLHRLWARADRALYRAKAAGRNRVCRG